MSDCWEMTWFGSIYTYESDPDGDGMVNAEEFARGSDPTAQESAARILDPQLRTDNTFSFRFIGIPNRTYTVQSTTALDGGTWVNETSFYLEAAEIRVEVPATPGTPVRFYRVVAP